MPIDVLVSNHSEWDGSIARMNSLRVAGAGAANPFVTGPQVAARSLQVMGECARAQARRFDYRARNDGAVAESDGGFGF